MYILENIINVCSEGGLNTTMKKHNVGRKLYSVGEAYMILYRAVRTMPSFLRASKKGVMKNDFTERLMLAVTEVNRCAMCSYAHTKMALEAGMSIDEINSLLAGDLSDVRPDEMPAILFAQHYADSRGRPSKEAWSSILRQYGDKKSIAILGAIRTVMLGNTYGVPLGNLKTRFSKNPHKVVDPRSSIWYELAMLGTFIVFIPCVIVHVLAAAVLRLPLIGFR